MQQYFLGVDASKGYADFTILNSQQETVMLNFRLDDTPAGHEKLYTLLADFLLKEHPGGMLSAGIESTGGYENNWFASLSRFGSELNLRTARLNPCGVSNSQKAGLIRVTTDKISAHGVAEYLITHAKKVNYNPQDRTAGLRKRYKFIQMLTKQQSQLLNHLESLMYSVHPQLMVYCRDGIPNWIYAVLKQYPSAARLARARTKTLVKIPFVTKDRARELIAEAKKSIASCSDPETEQVIKMTVQQILHLNKTVKAQKADLTRRCDLPEVVLLKTFNGIGDYSAVGLIIEIQDVSRFESPKKLASFFGVHPVFKSSGDYTGQFRMSKSGRVEPRRILYMVALSAINCNPLIKKNYEMHLQKGMAKMAAVGACMHKILRIVYGMLKNDSPFDPRIDETNRQNKKAVNHITKQDKNRRYQEIDPKAPVSRRQNLKRRGNGSQSQSDRVTECGIKAPVPTRN